jgi:transposase
MAHARGELFDEFERTKSPIAEEALQRIGQLYAIEVEINGQTTDCRRAVRQERAVPILADMKLWLEEQRRWLSSKTSLSKALQYALTRWDALTLLPFPRSPARPFAVLPHHRLGVLPLGSP